MVKKKTTKKASKKKPTKKKRTKRKTPRGKRKKQTALQKAESAKNKALKVYNSAKNRTNRDERYVMKIVNEHIKPHKGAYEKRLRRLKKAQDRVRADKKKESAARKKYQSVKKRYDRLHKDKLNRDAINNAFNRQKKGWRNEGKCAIFPTDAKGTGKTSAGKSIVFISPSDSESESNSSNVTSWEVDKGAPLSSYARFSSKTVTIGGILTGSRSNKHALRQWRLLRSWHANHRELTYHGDIYYKHLIITGLDRDFSTAYTDNLKVTITFTFVHTAQITTKSGKKHHKKTSKSSKSKQGNRNKKYSALTIKRGDTLWALSKKYHKSVSWLARVNHIKNPNLIYPGRKIRVR